MWRAISLTLTLELLAGCSAGAQSSQGLEATKDWPATCDDAVARLSDDLPQSEKVNLAAMSKDDLILLHHGFGTGIRNEFGLWGGNFALIESCTGSPSAHPDDVSVIIIERFWESLQ